MTEGQMNQLKAGQSLAYWFLNMSTHSQKVIYLHHKYFQYTGGFMAKIQFPDYSEKYVDIHHLHKL